MEITKNNRRDIQKILKGMPDYFELSENKVIMEIDRHPQYLMMNLETSCPYSCKKCALPGRSRIMGKNLTLNERNKIIKIAKRIRAKELVIIGAGEPSECGNFQNIVKPVIENAYKNGLGTVLFSTAFGINKKEATFFKNHDVTLFISLDSLNPKTYRDLTGVGDLKSVLKNIKILRDVYKNTPKDLPDSRKLIRLGINVTLHKDNVSELDKIKKFADDDMMFIVNAPMPEGKLRKLKNYQGVIGNYRIEELKKIASQKSDTGGHSSIADKACSYFHRGISIDSDGELLTCGYASETAHYLGNIRENMNAKKLVKHYQKVRKIYQKWCKSIGHIASCPLRDKKYTKFVDFIKS